MSTFERRMEILLMLNRCQLVTRARLASEFSVSDVTIGRDLNELARYAPICSKTGRYGGIYLLRNSRGGQTYLADDEIALLKKLIHTIPDCDKTILQRIIHKFSIPKV